MKTRSLDLVAFFGKWFCFGILLFSSASIVMAEVEIDLDDALKPSTGSQLKITPTPSNASHKGPLLTPTPTPAPQPKEDVSDTASDPANEADSAQEEDQQEEVRSPSEMIDFYKEGIQSYKDRDYASAVKYLNQAVKIQDKKTPRYYYAEAYATLGMIYQFHIVRNKTAYACYQKALKYEKNNKTAKKYIKQVKRKLGKRK